LGSILFGLIVGLHTTGVIHLNTVMNAEASMRRRIGFGLCGALVLFFCYRAMLGVVENYWLLPLKVKGHVYVVNRMAGGKGIQRGDVVAYSLQDSREPGMTFRGGYGLERVFGVAGDVIEFKAASITVNGQSFPRDPMMPVNQVITVPQKCWFIWPNYNIANRGIVPAESVKAGLLRAAIVPEETFVGRPYKYWFGRKQNFP
jgi:signal peptidase I